MINKSDYPYTTLIELKKFNIEFTKLIRQFDDFIDAVGDDYPVEMKSKSIDSFYFKIGTPQSLPAQHDPEQKGRTLFFPIFYKPKTAANVEDYSTTFVSDEALGALQRWLDLVKKYSNLQLTSDEEIEKIYEQEFFSGYEFTDPNAEQVPFDLETQIRIFKVLEFYKGRLSESKSGLPVADLIAEATQIQNELQNLSQAQTVSKLSKWVAKIRKRGIGLLTEVMKEIQKQVIKQMVEGGLDIVSGLISNN